MKHIIAAIALLAATAPALAEPTLPSHLDARTMEYRMWSAEQMIEHLALRLGKLDTACNYARRSESCKQSINSLYPQLKIIREVAARGDDVEWAKVVDIVHDLERNTEPTLNALNAIEGK